MKEYDLLIIGMGAAGLTAALYGAGYNLKTLVVGEMPGGVTGEANEIRNFPSYKLIKGFELAEKMMNQIKDSEVDTVFGKVLNIEKKSGGFEIRIEKESFSSKKVVLATGTEVKKLGLEREKEFLGKGISYCATCDAAFYKRKIVGVVGGGNSALTSAMLIAKFAKKVYIIYRKDKFYKAFPSYVEKLNEETKIETIFSSNVTKLLGKEKLEGVFLDTGKKLKLDGLFIMIGGSPNVNLSKNLKIELENGHIKVDKFQETNLKGFFAAGDVTNNPLKQIITACSGGAIAANTSFKQITDDSTSK